MFFGLVAELGAKTFVDDGLDNGVDVWGRVLCPINGCVMRIEINGGCSNARNALKRLGNVPRAITAGHPVDRQLSRGGPGGLSPRRFAGCFD
jgi:hypothetical protein